MSLWVNCGPSVPSVECGSTFGVASTQASESLDIDFFGHKLSIEPANMIQLHTYFRCFYTFFRKGGLQALGRYVIIRAVNNKPTVANANPWV